MTSALKVMEFGVAFANVGPFAGPTEGALLAQAEAVKRDLGSV